MKLLADESVDGQIVIELRSANHDVTYVAELTPGIDDATVLKASWEENRIFLTADKDFGDLVFRQHSKHRGVVLLRLAGVEPDEKANMVRTVIAEYQDSIAENFVVVTRDAIRIRRSRR